MKNLLLAIVFVVLATGCGRSTSDLIGQLHATDATERLHAAKMMGDRPRDADQFVPALIDALKDQDAFVRRDAAHALAKFGAEAKPATTALSLAARQDKNLHVRQAAADALKQIDPNTAGVGKVKL